MTIQEALDRVAARERRWNASADNSGMAFRVAAVAPDITGMTARNKRWNATTAMNDNILQDAAWQPVDTVAVRYKVPVDYVERLVKAAGSLR